MKPTSRLSLAAGAVAIGLLLTVLSASAVAQTSVTVPGNASGDFGNGIAGSMPMVKALTVAGPGTITVLYVSGTVTDSGGINTGPNGTSGNAAGAQSPLQEAMGVSGGTINNLDALIRVFVPQSRVNATGFSAIDGTKNATPVGIVPCGLFFVGMGKTFAVKQAGTLFLGINDWNVSDNGGSFTVTVTGP